MDGRAHPPEWAPHTFQGFSTGKWEGDILTVYTTHLKQEWIRRNGVANSEKSTMVEHFIKHGNMMTHLEIWTDPVSLTEAEAISFAARTSCSTSAPAATGCGPVSTSDKEVVDRPHSDVPNYLPGHNPFEGDFAYRYGVPVEAARGGAETTYPEYQAKLRTLPKPAKPASGRLQLFPQESRLVTTHTKLFAALAMVRDLSASPRACTRSRPRARRRRPGARCWRQSTADLDVFHVGGNVYMLIGAGGNIGVQIGDEGVLVVDTGLAANSARESSRPSKSLSDTKPIRCRC